MDNQNFYQNDTYKIQKSVQENNSYTDIVTNF